MAVTLLYTTSFLSNAKLLNTVTDLELYGFLCEYKITPRAETW